VAGVKQYERMNKCQKAKLCHEFKLGYLSKPSSSNDENGQRLSNEHQRLHKIIRGAKFIKRIQCHLEAESSLGTKIRI